VANHLWLVDEGTCQPYEGTLDDYALELRSKRRVARQSDKAETAGDAPKENKKQARKDRAEQRKATAKLRKTVQETEKKMAKLGEQKQKLEARLADPKIYNGSTSDMMKLQVEHSEIKEAMDQAEAAWLEAQEALEGIA
jgi:ATP-binding cassette subfamily F protein 3